jgi:hypothetical protein
VFTRDKEGMGNAVRFSLLTLMEVLIV